LQESFQVGAVVTKYAIQSDILLMWIARTVEARLLRSARSRPVMVLTGARQTGKNSTLLWVSPDYQFISFDLASEAEQAE
jgi:uncharacterized protein